uniref:Uncharacterized protein n=1 Tax=viral metagenome TaxID=1070528 RepID=A0A6H1ZGU8_9ZZZZ
MAQEKRSRPAIRDGNGQMLPVAASSPKMQTGGARSPITVTATPRMIKPPKGAAVLIFSSSSTLYYGTGSALNGTTDGNGYKIYRPSGDCRIPCANREVVYIRSVSGSATVDFFFEMDGGGGGGQSGGSSASEGTTNDATPGMASLAGATATAAVVTYDEGDLAALSVDLYGNLRTRIEDAQAVHDDPAPAEVLMQGQYAATAVPAAVYNGATVRPWYNEYGQQVLGGYGIDNDTIKVSDQAPAVQQKVNIPAETLNDPEDASTAVNVRPYKNVCYRVTAANVTNTLYIQIQGSIDNSTFGALPLQEGDVTGMSTAGGTCTITADGTYFVCAANIAVSQVKLVWLAGGGSPAATALTVEGMAGN